MNDYDITREIKGIKLSDIQKDVPKKKINRSKDYYVEEEVISVNTGGHEIEELNFITEGELKDKIKRDRREV